MQGAVAALRSAYGRARAHDEDAAAGAEGHAGEAEACLAALKQAISEHAERLHAERLHGSPSAETTQASVFASLLTLTLTLTLLLTLTLTLAVTLTLSSCSSTQKLCGRAARDQTLSPTANPDPK